MSTLIWWLFITICWKLLNFSTINCLTRPSPGCRGFLTHGCKIDGNVVKKRHHSLAAGGDADWHRLNVPTPESECCSRQRLITGPVRGRLEPRCFINTSVSVQVGPTHPQTHKLKVAGEDPESCTAWVFVRFGNDSLTYRVSETKRC